MNDTNTLKTIYRYQLTEGCNGFNCMSPYCANSPKFEMQTIDYAESLAKNHAKESHICLYLSPLVKNPSIYGKICNFQNFYIQLKKGEIIDKEGLKQLLIDPEAFQHILYSEDRPLSKTDLVLNDDECDSFRQLLIKNESKLSCFQKNFSVLIQKMATFDAVDSFHFIRGLIVASLFQIFLGFNTFHQGFYKLITIIVDVADVNRFCDFIEKLPKVFKSFVFLIQSNLSSYIIQIKCTSLDDKVILKICRLLQILSISNKFISPLCFVNDLVTSLFDVEAESKIWNSSKFTFIIYKNVLSCDKRIDFLNKIKEFGLKQLLLNVRRSKIANDSLILLKQDDLDLRRKICVQFIGEVGIDMGGLTKEYFHLVTKYITNPKNYLFDIIDDRYSWFSNKKYEDLCWYKLMGIILGLSIHNKIMLPVRFPKILYKKLCGSKIELYDLKEIKPDVARQLEHIEEYIDDCELYFSVSSYVNGTLIDIDLLEDGSNILVTRENFKKYINLMVNWYGNLEMSDQFNSLNEGFHMVADYEVGFWFSDIELDMIISGSDVYDWVAFQMATEYEGYTVEDKTIIDFWNIFQEFNQEEKLKLMLFITGSQVIPVAGIQNIKIKIIRTTNLNMIPEAHTCIMSLVLPDYKNREKLKSPLKICIENCQGFGFK